MESIKDGSARLRIIYRLFSYDGQGDPSLIEEVVPVMGRGVRAQRWGRQSPSAA